MVDGLWGGDELVLDHMMSGFVAVVSHALPVH